MHFPWLTFAQLQKDLLQLQESFQAVSKEIFQLVAYAYLSQAPQRPIFNYVWEPDNIRWYMPISPERSLAACCSISPASSVALSGKPLLRSESLIMTLLWGLAILNPQYRMKLANLLVTFWWGGVVGVNLAFGLRNNFRWFNIMMGFSMKILEKISFWKIGAW